MASNSKNDRTDVRPMADERETAQWYMSNGLSQDDAKKLLRAEVPNAEKTCYKFGGLAAWQPLPQAAKEALRRELYRIRSIGEEIDRAAGRDPNTGETNEEKERRIAQAFGIKQEEPEETNPASATSEANREQEQRVGLRIAEVSQLSPAPGVFVNLPERIQKYWGDGADEKNRATLELDEATANVAKAAELVIEFIDLLDPYKEQWLALRDAIANRRAKQEAFLRAMANQPDPNNTGRPDGQLPALTGSKIWTRTQAPAAALGPCICKDLEDTGNQ